MMGLMNLDTLIVLALLAIVAVGIYIIFNEASLKIEEAKKEIPPLPTQKALEEAFKEFLRSGETFIPHDKRAVDVFIEKWEAAFEYFRFKQEIKKFWDNTPQFNSMVSLYPIMVEKNKRSLNNVVGEDGELLEDIDT